MPKVGYFVILQTNKIFGIALHFSKNIKYYQEGWKNLSVEILYKISDCRAAAGPIATVTVLLDSKWDRNFSMGISVLFLEIDFYINI